MSKKALLAVALPFITNPVVLGVVCIGAIGLILFDNKEEQDNDAETVPDGSKPYDEPLDDEISTVKETVCPDWGTVEATVEKTVSPTVEEPLLTAPTVVSTTSETMTDDELKKEMIRQTMSELGKRSAAARARKRN